MSGLHPLFPLSLFLCLVLTGCSAKLPRTVAARGQAVQAAEERLDNYLAKRCAGAVDSDVELTWEAYGRHEKYAATLQAQKPALLRLALVDPLGRPQLLLVSDGHYFSLADNRRTEGLTGPLASAFIDKYLPGGVAGDLFSWLSGRAAVQGREVLSIKKAAAGDLFWYGFDRGAFTELLVLGPEYLQRRLLLDSSDRIIFDVQYSGYQKTTDGCSWPGRLVVTGEELPAEFKLTFSQIYDTVPLAEKTFELKFPSHFTVRRVE